MNKQQGFIQFILLIVVIIALGGGTWFVYRNYIQPNPDVAQVNPQVVQPSSVVKNEVTPLNNSVPTNKPKIPLINSPIPSPSTKASSINPFQAITTFIQNIIKQPTPSQTTNVSPTSSTTTPTTVPTTINKTGYAGNNCHLKSPTDHSIVCGP